MTQASPIAATARMANFVRDTRYEDLPPEVVRECKRMLLDSLGCAIGALETESGRIGLQFASMTGGKPSVTLVGSGEKTSVLAAAYANARLGGVLDADDTFPSLGHFGNTTSFTALAMAEHLGRSGRDLLAGIAAGFDLGARVCNAIGLPFKLENGKVAGYGDRGGGSSSIVWAAVGAATSLARLTPQQTAHAFGIAGANTPLPTLTEWAALVDLPMIKVADAGWGAQTGISATLLASLGSTGFSEILDKKVGFWRFFGSDTLDREALLGGLGSEWRILDTTYKPWPSCRWIHYPMTAFANLQREHGLAAEEIERVVVRANPFSLSPRFHVQQPVGMINAEFSYAHSLAMLVHRVPVGPRWYSEENLGSAAVRAFRGKVEVTAEPLAANLADWLQGGQFRRLPAGVDVHARGRVYSATVDNAVGDPWTPQTLMTDEMIREKFIGMVLSGDDSGARRQAANRIIDAIDRLESFERLDDLVRLLHLPH